MLSFLITFYLLVMPLLLMHWLSALLRDSTKMSAVQKRLSFGVLFIATLGWPIVLPFVYLELLSNAQRSARQAKLVEMQFLLNQY